MYATNNLELEHDIGQIRLEDNNYIKIYENIIYVYLNNK